MAQWLQVPAVLPQDPTEFDSQHPLGDSQLTGDQTPLLASSGTRHRSGTQTSQQAKQHRRYQRTTSVVSGRIQHSPGLCWRLQSNSALSTTFTNDSERKRDKHQKQSAGGRKGAELSEHSQFIRLLRVPHRNCKAKLCSRSRKQKQKAFKAPSYMKPQRKTQRTSRTRKP